MITIQSRLISPWRKITLSTVMLLLLISPLFELTRSNKLSLAYTHYLLGSAKNPDIDFGLTDYQHTRLHLWLASKAISNGNLVEAYENINFLGADNPLAAHYLGIVLAKQGEYPLAVTTWQEIGDFVSLQRAAEEAVDSGDVENAFLAFKALYEMKPEGNTLPFADFLWNKYYDPSYAESLIKQTIVEYPNSRYGWKWLRFLGDLLLEQERWSESKDAYLNVLEIEPEDFQAHIGLIWSMYLGGDGFHMVAPLLQQVITLFPERGETYLVMAEILVYEERFDEADQFFEQALDLNPDRKWWYLQRARAARDSDNNPAAMDYYIKTIQLFPEFKHAYHDLAKLYLSNEKLELAKETIEIAIQLDKSPTARIYVDAGKIYEALGESAKAENAYQQALVIDPDNKAALRGLLNLNAEGE